MADVAPVDVGTLVRVGARGNARRSGRGGAGGCTGPQHPDNDATGISERVGDRDRMVRDVTVGVDITHTYIGDLEVRWCHPPAHRESFTSEQEAGRTIWWQLHGGDAPGSERR